MMIDKKFLKKLDNLGADHRYINYNINSNSENDYKTTIENREKKLKVNNFVPNLNRARERERKREI